jgi:iron(III) transport system ATP-binding protein
MAADRAPRGPGVSGVTISGVAKSFGSRRAPVPVLHGVDLEVPAGRLVAVLGPSGCGKTTLLRVVAGFERADAGRVVVGGREVVGPGTHVPPERRGVGVVPQDQALFPHLSVAGNVGYGVRRAERTARVGELLELAGLVGLGDRMPHELSGGQQQRVALARALAPRPGVVLLDEPFGGLDAALRTSLRAEVRGILHASGTTAVLVTHDQEEALSVADLVAVMRAGRVVQAAPPADLYRRPVDLGVATFVGDAVVLPGTRSGETVDCPLGRLAAVPGAGDGPVTVVVRPEQVEVVAVDGVPAVVTDRLYFGHDALVRLRLGSGVLVSARTSSAAAAEPGQQVRVRARGPVLAFPADEGRPA